MSEKINSLNEEIKNMFENAKNIFSTFTESQIIENFIFNVFSSFFYGNLYKKFFSNLNEDYALEMNIPLDRLSNIKNCYTYFDKEVSEFLSDPISTSIEYDKMNRKSYEKFKKEIHCNFIEFFPIISELEKYFDIDEFERQIEKKKMECKNIFKSSDDFKFLLLTKIIEIKINNNEITNLKELKDFYHKSEDEEIYSTAKEISLPFYELEKEKQLKIITEKNKERIQFEKRLYDRWKTPLDLYDMMIYFAIELGEKYKKRIPNDHGIIKNPKYVALIKIHSRSILIAREILVLLKAGYVDGAMSRCRTLHELDVISFFLKSNEEYVSERYMSHSDMMSFKRTKDFNFYANKTGYKEFTKEEMNSFQEITNNLIKKYGDGFDFGDWDWIPKSIIKDRNFKELERYVNLDIHRPYYNWYCDPVHGGSHGFKYLGLPEEEQEKILFIGPSNHGLTDPIDSATISLMHTTINLIDMNSKDIESDFLKDLNLLLLFQGEIGNTALKITKEYDRNED